MTLRCLKFLPVWHTALYHGKSHSNKNSSIQEGAAAVSNGRHLTPSALGAPYFEAVLLPVRRSSSSITVVMLSSGTAPLMNRPLMNIAGVPLTPAAEPALMSA